MPRVWTVMRFICAVAVGLSLALIPSAAMAQSRCVAPPGSSAVDQYCEVVPDGTGGTGGGGDGGPTVGSGTAQQLEKAGPAGQAVLTLSGGAPPAKKDAGANRSGTSDAGVGNRSASDPALQDTDAGTKDNNVIKAAAASSTEATRVGSGFIWILIAVIAGVGAWGWVAYRRRQARQSGPSDHDV